MRRAALVVSLGVALLLVLGLARMRDTVDDELAGARMLAQLAERLSTLADQPDTAARQALREWQDGGELRHLRVTVSDASGATVMDEAPTRRLSTPMHWLANAGTNLFQRAPSFTVAWPLARPDGTVWRATLTAVPESERVEALTSLFEGVALLAGIGLLMLAVLGWNTRRAFRPLAQLLVAITRLEGAPTLAGASGARHLPPMPIAELETIAAALRHLDAALDAAEQQRRHLVGQVLGLQEDERQRLARELHDEFGQRLTALRVNAAWLARRLAGHAELLPVVQDMATQCESVQGDIRAVLTRLRPLGPLAEQTPGRPVDGVPMAELARLLQSLVADWQRGAEATTVYRLDLRIKRDDGPAEPWPHEADPAWPALPHGTALALYRISQEALTNVARHAKATRALLAVCVCLPSVTRAGRIDWSVEDDGLGVAEPAAAFGRGNGLAGLKERLWALGADLSMGPAQPEMPAPGWRLSASLGLPLLSVITCDLPP